MTTRVMVRPTPQLWKLICLITRKHSDGYIREQSAWRCTRCRADMGIGE